METLLISGPKRSGTHLLYRLFDSHSELFNALAETYFLEYVDSVEDKEVELLLEWLSTAELVPLFEQIRERALLPLFDEDADHGKGHGPNQNMHVSIDQEHLRSEFDTLRQSVDRSVDGLWKAWFEALQRVSTPDKPSKRVVFKCADYGPSARTAANALQQRKILFIVRNPVFTFSSLRKLRTQQPQRPKFTTLRLIEEISNYRRFNRTRKCLAERRDVDTYTVRFEDLVTDPESTMKKICNFADLEFQKILTKPTFLDGNWKGDSSYDSYESVSKKPLNPSRINLTDDEREMVDTRMNEILADFNYDVYPSHPDDVV